MKYLARLTYLIICLCAVSTTFAAEPNIDRLKAQQKQLQSILDEVEKASQERTQHSEQIKRLKHQLECNWTLIRSYEICGQLHGNNPTEYLNCSTSAKRTAAACLSSDTPE